VRLRVSDQSVLAEYVPVDAETPERTLVLLDEMNLCQFP